MNERIFVITQNIADPDNSASVTTGACYFMLPVQATLVAVSVSAHDDDAGATIDILDDGTDIVTGIDASDQDVPGEWLSTDFGGTNAPVEIAAGSEMSIDVNSAAAANRFDVVMYFKSGSLYG
jgi:hypothetical protein